MGIFFSSMAAYVLQRKEFRPRTFFSVFFYFTTIFNGGIVPWYILMIRYFNMKNNIMALILPNLFNVFYIIIIRSFISNSIPDSITESAKIDGASETRIFFQICLPLSLPGIATITLFTALAYWNDWFNALLYIRSDNLVPLQYLLIKIQQNLDYLSKSVGASAQLAGLTNSFPKESARMAMVVLATVPIACVYPFFQRYFVKGLTIGGVKE